MKKIFTLLLFLLPTFSSAQALKGAVYYEETVAFKMELPPEMQREAANLPKSFTSNKVLYIDTNKTLYKEDNSEQKKKDQNTGDIRMGSEESGMVMVVRRGNNNNMLYKDLDQNTFVNKTNFLGRDFLISDELKPFAWQVSEEQQTILGYPCIKATYQDTTQAPMGMKIIMNDGNKETKTEKAPPQIVTAWFAPTLPVASGPDKYFGLPGVILKLEIGDRVIVANKVDLASTETIKIPEGGQKMNQKEFDALRDQKMREMQEEMGGNRRNNGGSTTTIRIGRN
jgi:GLPGLI family protein